MNEFGECRVTTDPSEVDMGAVIDFLANEAQWGRWRTTEQLREQILSAWRITALIEPRSGHTVGFARAVSDGVGLAYLADVYVLPEYRGQGLAQLMLTEMIDNGPGRQFRWLLHADDARRLYAKLGFLPADRVLERSAPPE